MSLCHVIIADENVIADAVAEELRDRLKQLAKQVVDLQVRGMFTLPPAP